MRNNDYCFQGRLDGKPYIFKIDTGSDVSMISKRLVKAPRKLIEIKDSCLSYLTGEMVLIHSKVMVTVELGKFILACVCR